MEKTPRGPTIESAHIEPVLSEEIKSSLDRTFDWHLSSDRPAQASFDNVVAMLVDDPRLIPLAKRHLTEAWWAQQDFEASQSALQRLGWALVEALAKVQI